MTKDEVVYREIVIGCPPPTATHALTDDEAWVAVGLTAAAALARFCQAGDGSLFVVPIFLAAVFAAARHNQGGGS